MSRRLITARTGIFVAGTIAVMGCRAPEQIAVVDDERPTRVETHWTESHEWFVEHPLLVQGESAEFAAHLTSLADFRAIEVGRLEVALLDASGMERQRVVAETIARPGIFLPVITPDWTGNGRLVLSYHAPDGATDQVGWDVRVAASAADLGSLPPTPDGIGFLKEQQWRIPFTTVSVSPTAIRDTLILPATIESHERFTAAVVPPGPGIFRAAEAGLAGPGTPVRSGQVLGYLHPSLSVGDDWSSLRSALVRARNDATEAGHERDRAERLVAAGAVPRRRLAEARSALDNAEARLETVAARVDVLENLGSGTSGPLALMAPMSGIVAQVMVTNGEPVDAERVLFRIVDLEHLVVRVEVPEPELVRLLAAIAEGNTVRAIVRPGGARNAIPRPEDWIVAGRLLDIGTEVDAATRTAPFRYELSGAGDRLRPGMSAEAQLQIGGTRQALTVPSSSVIDLAGVSVVYVQLGGETFEERVVVTGVLNGDVIEIVSGLSPGDHVVTVGAYLVRLAALSPDAAPAHSH